MTYPIDSLQQVITYNKSNLATLQNQNAFISTANTQFKDFNTSTPQNLGSVVSFDLPPRFTTVNSLVLSTEAADQRTHQLALTQEASVSYPFTTQNMILNIEPMDYLKNFGRGAIAELGAQIESDIATVAETNTFRFYGDGRTGITTSLQLASALAFFDNFGTAPGRKKGYLSNMTYPNIVNSNLAQFAPARNDSQANSWEMGDFDNCDWYKSNLLTTHTAGTEGNVGSTLTVVSVTRNADGGIITITFSGCSSASDASSIKAYDKFVFNDGVSSFTNLRYRTWTGHKVSECPVQFRATADAASTGGSQVTVSIYPALQAASGKNQNLNVDIVAGMQVSVLPSHRCGLITSGDPLYLAMPRLNDQRPFDTSIEMDPETGVSLRTYFGTIFGQNQQIMAHDCYWGKTLVDEYSMMVALPL